MWRLPWPGFIRVIDSGLVGSTDYGRGTTRADDAQGTPTENHTSPSIQVYEDSSRLTDLGLLITGFPCSHVGCVWGELQVGAA